MTEKRRFGRIYNLYQAASFPWQPFFYYLQLLKARTQLDKSSANASH